MDNCRDWMMEEPFDEVDLCGACGGLGYYSDDEDLPQVCPNCQGVGYIGFEEDDGVEGCDLDHKKRDEDADEGI